MKAWFVMAAGVAVALLPLAPAAAGGFCAGYNGERVTDAAGDKVVMRDNCFGPTVARVERGGTVRFVNQDPEAHAVGGTAGSFGDMHKPIGPSKSVAFTFERDGIFPYVCILHPGMAGAVVVGDGVGPSSTGLVAAAASDPTGMNPDPPPAQSGANAGPALLPIGLGIGAVSTVTALLVRRQRRSRAASASV
jgi:plastocyanin